MEIRHYIPLDCPEMLTLFRETVHHINSRDYVPEQLEAWAPAEPDRRRWEDSLAAHDAWVAVKEGRLVGFVDWDISTGYLDRLYVHKDNQREGIGAALCDKVEEQARLYSIKRLYTESSITARPFFEHRGYQLVKQQQKPLRGQVFLNYVMELYLEQ